VGPSCFSGTEGTEESERFGEVGMAAILAGIFAFPAGMYLAGRTGIPLAFTGAAMIFLILFVFLPEIIRQVMLANPAEILETFGKNEHVRNVFWGVFAALARLVLTQILDPATAQRIIGIITGMSV